MAILLRQSDETQLNNFPKDYMLPTFFSPLQGNYKENVWIFWSSTDYWIDKVADDLSFRKS